MALEGGACFQSLLYSQNKGRNPFGIAAWLLVEAAGVEPASLTLSRAPCYMLSRYWIFSAGLETATARRASRRNGGQTPARNALAPFSRCRRPASPIGSRGTDVPRQLSGNSVFFAIYVFLTHFYEAKCRLRHADPPYDEKSNSGTPP